MTNFSINLKLHSNFLANSICCHNRICCRCMTVCCHSVNKLLHIIFKRFYWKSLSYNSCWSNNYFLRLNSYCVCKKLRNFLCNLLTVSITCICVFWIDNNCFCSAAALFKMLFSNNYRCTFYFILSINTCRITLFFTVHNTKVKLFLNRIYTAVKSVCDKTFSSTYSTFNIFISVKNLFSHYEPPVFLHY